MEFNSMELMICLAARELEDNSIVVAGTGAPCAAAMLAQKTQSPNLNILFEAGGLGPELPSMPISVGDSRTFHRAIAATSMPEIMETCQRGMVDYTFLGGAQLDMYGNLNSTMIGTDHDKPKVRMPGSGGANDLASLCWKTMVLTVHNAQRFVEKCAARLPAGYSVAIGGTLEDSSKAQASIFAVFPLMLGIMLTILMIQLRSFQSLIMVLMTAPLALIGVAAALLLFNVPMGFVAILGVISLAGMVIRNSVILIEQFEQHIAAGEHPWEAVISATQHRLRPILLTAAAAILGMLPIASTVFWGPMAYAVIGGLLVATLLTLVFLPALYVAWHRITPPVAVAPVATVPAAAVPA